MTATEFTEAIQNTLTDSDEFVEALVENGLGEDDAWVNIRTFADTDLLTLDKGLVVNLSDGTEFQVTVVQSERGTDDDGE